MLWMIALVSARAAPGRNKVVSEREDAVCKALSHPLRRQMLEELLGGECDVSVMQQRAGADQPTVSKHLAVLRDAGLVAVRTSGRRRCYTLAEPALIRNLLAVLSELSAKQTPHRPA